MRAPPGIPRTVSRRSSERKSERRRLNEEPVAFCVAMAHVLVCGSGNAAQALACLFGARYKVVCLCLEDGEADQWRHAVAQGPMVCTLPQEQKSVRSAPDLITSDPSCVAACDMVLLTVQNAQEAYFQALAPHVRAGTIFGVMPARSGIDFLFRQAMGAKADALGLVAFETLPWACKFEKWGKTSTVLGIKDTVMAAALPPRGVSAHHIMMKMQGLIGVKPTIQACPNLMTISLSNPGQVVHPGLMYSRWRDWDGKPLAERPLFYHGADDLAAKTLGDISSEIQAVCRRLRALDSSYDVSQVKTFFDWYKEQYAADCSDSSSLQKALVTNHAYRGLCHPCKVVKGKFLPDFKHRYLSDDVPTGLCFARGVAELLGVQMPTATTVILWAQTQLGKEYLTPDGRMAGKDLADTRAPQAFGVATRADLVRFLGLRGPSPLACFVGICG